MSTKNLSGECQNCGGRFEFPAEAAGLTGECPHCGQATECLLASPPEEKSPAQTRTVIYTIVAVVILVGGLIGALAALKRAQRQFGRKQEAQTQTSALRPPKLADPFAAEGFRASTVTLDTTPGTKLVHAHGSIVNTTNRQRFEVRVELDLFDSAGKWVGKASDYKDVIEPNAEWKFSAPVVEAKAASAKVAAIKETK
jgi:hypothetical protein